MMNVSKFFSALLEPLSDRQKEVVLARYGLLKGKEGETLEAIGERYGITRERVRQIENSALDIVAQQIAANPIHSKLLNEGRSLLKSAGGVAGEDSFLKKLGHSVEGLTAGHLAVLLHATGSFNVCPEDKNFKPFYYLTSGDQKSAENFIDGWAAYLKSHKNDVLEGNYDAHLNKFIKSKSVNKNHASSYLNISKRLHVNPYGDVGLAEWPEIKPQTTRDKIYLILKKKGEPLHFSTIAELINEVKFDDNVALAPTVHNELIKDPRFVLVGRGLYGLREYGYEPGTAREVIHTILKRQGPLHAADVIKHVNKQRFFKPNTILINLQNRNNFERLEDGRYRIREA